MITIGDKAPDFKLKDQNGKEHSLAYHKGSLIVLYFYPKDDTPGCTTEACAIRDVYNDFARAGVKVFGVSKDSVESHKKFEEKYKLPFTLLSDPDRDAIEKYDAKKMIFNSVGTKRITYLIGKDGKILKIYPKVDPTTHAGEMLKDIYALEN